MKKLIPAALTAALAITAPAHSLASKKAGDLSVGCTDVKVHRDGDKMHVSFRLVMDSLKVGTNEAITFRPIICNATDTASFTPVTVNGRNRELKLLRNPDWRNPDAVEIARTKGPQSYDFSGSVPYSDWMVHSELKIAEDLCGCGHLKDQAQKPVTPIDFRAPAPPTVAYITPKAEAEKARDESGQAFVDFIVNKTNIVPTYRNNRVELAKITSTIDLVKNDPFVSITNIDLHGYASPEGTYANNTRLASGRSAALKEYVKGLYDMPDNIFTSHYTPEDWGNLRKLVEQSNLPEKEEILSIIDTNADYDDRDHEIRRRFPKTYAFMLSEWYPGLRHTDYKVSYVVRPLTIDESKQVLKTNPKNLSLNEMFLVAQTYEAGSPEFNNVFETAVKVFPDDPTANLNAACTAINSGDLAAAARYLAKAGDTPEAIHARGLLALKEGRYDESRRLLNEAARLGIKEAEGNIAILDRTERLAKQGF